MEFTGERFLPSEPGVIAYEHWHRYAAAARLLGAKRVLDAACGEGYGTALIAQHAAEAIGVDSAADVVENAARAYAGQASLSFQQATLPHLPFESGSFDAVVSFETLEHVDDADASIAEFKRVLRPGGLLVASTPDREIYTDVQGNRNKFHVREMNRSEFSSTLRRHFRHLAVVGQRVYVASVIGPDAPSGAPTMDCFGMSGGRAVCGAAAVLRPTYLLCFCSDSELPEAVGRPSAMLDNDEAAQGEREAMMGWAQTLKRERDAASAARDALADQAEGVLQERDALAAENMELRHSQRRYGLALEQLAKDLAELRSGELIERVVAAAATTAAAPLHGLVQSLAEEVATLADLRAADAETFRLAAGDIASGVAALARVQSRDVEGIRSAAAHDRVAMEAVIKRLDGEAAASSETMSLRAQLDAMRNSTSWQITKPLRALRRRF